MNSYEGLQRLITRIIRHRLAPFSTGTIIINRYEDATTFDIIYDFTLGTFEGERYKQRMPLDQVYKDQVDIAIRVGESVANYFLSLMNEPVPDNIVLSEN